MASIFYLDHNLGNDATTNTPLGWWSVAYTGGTGPAPAADEIVTGATSNKTAKLTVVVAPTSGSWAGNDAAGTMYFYGKSGAFVAEQVDCAGGGHFHIAADFVYCAWKVVTTGGTIARLTDGDSVRMAKQGTPVVKLTGATGKATWVNQQNYITLDAAQTINIDRCETAWTKNASGDATVTRTGVATQAREGSYCMKIALDSSPQASTMQAYFATGTIDLSTCNELSFSLMASAGSASTSGNMWTITLCSNNNGTGVVDTFLIPKIGSSNVWVPLTLTRVGGGYFGNSIKSIAINTGTDVSGSASKFVYVDNFLGCISGGLNLNSLISKDSSEMFSDTDDGWYPIQSINGTTVYFDQNGTVKSQLGPKYYSATASENVDTYIRTPLMQTVILGNVANLYYDRNQQAGITYEGGYNTATNEVDGVTLIDGHGGGIGFDFGAYVACSLTGLTYVRAYYGLQLGETRDKLIAHNYVGCFVGLSTSANMNQASIDRIINFNNNNQAIYHSGCNFSLDNLLTKGCVYGINVSGSNGIFHINEFIAYNCTNVFSIENFGHTVTKLISNYSSYVFGSSGDSELRIKYADIQNVATAVVGTVGNTGNVSSFYIDKLASTGYSKVYLHTGTITHQTATAGGTGLEWSVEPTSIVYRFEDNPIPVILGRIYVASADIGSTITFTVYCKKSSDLGVNAYIKCAKNQLAGITTHQISTCPLDTNRNLLSISFIPTESGMIEIYGYVWGNGSAIFDDVAISKA